MARAKTRTAKTAANSRPAKAAEAKTSAADAWGLIKGATAEDLAEWRKEAARLENELAGLRALIRLTSARIEGKPARPRRKGRRLTVDDQSPGKTLAQRIRECIVRAGKPLDSKEIAAQLGVTPQAVGTCVGRNADGWFDRSFDKKITLGAHPEGDGDDE